AKRQRRGAGPLEPDFTRAEGISPVAQLLGDPHERVAAVAVEADRDERVAHRTLAGAGVAELLAGCTEGRALLGRGRTQTLHPGRLVAPDPFTPLDVAGFLHALADFLRERAEIDDHGHRRFLL